MVLLTACEALDYSDECRLLDTGHLGCVASFMESRHVLDFSKIIEGEQREERGWREFQGGLACLTMSPLRVESIELGSPREPML